MRSSEPNLNECLPQVLFRIAAKSWEPIGRTSFVGSPLPMVPPVPEVGNVSFGKRRTSSGIRLLYAPPCAPQSWVISKPTASGWETCTRVNRLYPYFTFRKVVELNVWTSSITPLLELNPNDCPS